VWNKSFSDPRATGTALPLQARRLALSADGALVAVWARRAGGVQLWRADGTAVGVIDTGPDLVHTIEFTPDSSRLAVATSKTVTMWDVAKRERLAWGEGASGATALAFSPNGQWLATVDRDRVVRLHETATGREVRRFTGTALQVFVLTFSPDGTRLVTGGGDRTVRVWDVESGRELLSLPGVTHVVTGIAWDGPRDRIYALDHAVRVWGTSDK
jgi:WD40 repeat protein